MKVVVVGATGTIGAAVADLFREKGHEVIGASRSSKPAINIDKPDTIDAFFDEVGPVDAVICAAGHANFGALTELSSDAIARGLNSKLLGQVNLVRQGINRVNPKGIFVITGGMLAYSPWPKTSAVAMINAGLEGFARAAALDLPDEKRVLIVHPPLLRETAEKMGTDADPWPNAREVAKAYDQAVESEDNGVPVFVKNYEPE